jgi:hypothetical protein
MNVTISLLNAEKKYQELKASTWHAQQWLADAAREAFIVPFKLKKPDIVGSILFSGDVDYAVLSKWLADAGWFLTIEYEYHGDNKIATDIWMSYYSKRSTLGEEAILELAPSNRVGTAQYY